MWPLPPALGIPTTNLKSALVLQLDFGFSGAVPSCSVVAEAGVVLVMSSPARPGDDAMGFTLRDTNHSGEEAANFGHGERNQRAFFFRAEDVAA